MEDCIKATILGNCIGDAMGCLTNFLTRDEAQRLYASFRGEMTYNLRQIVSSGVERSIPVGFWTETSDQMLLIMDSWVKCDGVVSTKRFGDLICAWCFGKGFPELHAAGRPKPIIGTTMYKVVKNPMFPVDPMSAARIVWLRDGCKNASNGGILRTAVVGLYMAGDSEIVGQNTSKMCGTTHADPRCIASCVAVTTAISEMLQKPHDTDEEMEAIFLSAYNSAVNVLQEQKFEQFVPELKSYMNTKNLRDLKLDEPESGAYTFATLAVAFWALRQKDMRTAIETLVMEAGSSAVNCAVAGAMLGCKLGMKGIPQQWLQELKMRDWLEAKINKFTQMVKSPPPAALEYFQIQQGLLPPPSAPSTHSAATQVTAATAATAAKPAKPTTPSDVQLEFKCDPLEKNILGVLYGHAIGDAIGLLSEFLTKEEADMYYTHYKGKLTYDLKELVGDRHRRAWLVGDWTDDTDQMVVIMESIIHSRGEVNVVDFAKRLKNWACYGFKELGDKMGCGLGATTKNVLMRPDFETDPVGAAENYWSVTGSVAAPNGAVMRTSILGVLGYRDIPTVIANARAVCTVTHADPRCQASCVAVATAIALMLQQRPETEEQLTAIIHQSYNYAKQTLESLDAKEHIAELRKYMFISSLKDLELARGQSIGYTYKCLGAGFWALRQPDFRTALEAIVFEAGDADTNGAVAGALLGCRLGGVHALPKEWVEGLKYRQWLDDIIQQFLLILRDQKGAAKRVDKGEAALYPKLDRAKYSPDSDDSFDDPAPYKDYKDRKDYKDYHKHKLVDEDFFPDNDKKDAWGKRK